MNVLLRKKHAALFLQSYKHEKYFSSISLFLCLSHISLGQYCQKMSKVGVQIYNGGGCIKEVDGHIGSFL